MIAKTVLLLNGPNLNQLGKRDPVIYGVETLDDVERRARLVAQSLGWSLEHAHSANEAELVATIHNARHRVGLVVINAGAFTHYSWAIHDALQLFTGPIIEVHISQVIAREPWRHTSVISPVATSVISGLGVRGYEVAVAEGIRLVN